MARKIKWWSSNGYVGSEREDEIKVDDDATDEEIEEQVLDDVMNFFQWGWKEVTDETNKL